MAGNLHWLSYVSGMETPSLRHFRSEGIYTISSDPVEALVGEAWIPARYTDRGWATADGSTLLTGVEEWRYEATEEGSQGDARVQGRNTAHRKARSRKGSSGQEQETGACDCPIAGGDQCRTEEA